MPPEGAHPVTELARLQGLVKAQAALIDRQATALLHTEKIFRRASEAARIGVWECSLPGEGLQWTDVVYDLFDLPRGADIRRDEIVGFYHESSARELHLRRSRAIAERTGFSLDAGIVTATGRRRWLRITATVECEGGVPVRLFGMKQDITEEKLLMDRTRDLAELDHLTGLANRGRFRARFEELGEGQDTDLLRALMIVDLDGFKAINDTFGHAGGDACLIQMASRLKQACEGADLVARIGGDEFVVLIGADMDRADVAAMAHRVLRFLNGPVEWGGRWLGASASVGIAFVDEGSRGRHLYSCADAALYEAKAAGRNTFRIYKSSSGSEAGRFFAA